jgi:hypothetical protein
MSIGVVSFSSEIVRSLSLSSSCLGLLVLNLALTRLQTDSQLIKNRIIRLNEMASMDYILCGYIANAFA